MEKGESKKGEKVYKKKKDLGQNLRECAEFERGETDWVTIAKRDEKHKTSDSSGIKREKEKKGLQTLCHSLSMR